MKKIINPYKGHEHDGGDDYGRVDCLKCETEMLWNLRMNNSKLDIFPKAIKRSKHEKK